jgi:hypothetical protein
LKLTQGIARPQAIYRWTTSVRRSAAELATRKILLAAKNDIDFLKKGVYVLYVMD